MAQQNIVSGEVVRGELKNFYEKPVTRVSLELVFSLLTVIFFALFALRPTLNTMSQLVKEIEDKRAVDEGLTKKIAALSTAQNEYFTYRDRFGILDNAVHTDLKLDDTLYFLEYLAGRENINLTSLRIREFPVGNIGGEDPSAAPSDARPTSAAKKPKVIGIYSLNLTFAGKYPDMLRFFQTLEKTRPLFAVQGFSFSTRRDRGEQFELTANATVFSYGYLDADVASGTKLEKVVDEEPKL